MLTFTSISVFASTIGLQFSKVQQNRLNTFVRTTKLPPGQYVIGVYSTGNTITQYEEPEMSTNIIEKEIIKEVPIEKEIVKYITVEKEIPIATWSVILSYEDRIDLWRCKEYARGRIIITKEQCVYDFMYKHFLYPEPQMMPSKYY